MTQCYNKINDFMSSEESGTEDGNVVQVNVNHNRCSFPIGLSQTIDKTVKNR